MNAVLKYVKTYIILIIIFVLSLTTVSAIPSKYLKKNTQKSSDYLIKLGKYENMQDVQKTQNTQNIKLPFKTLILFLYTDALMINTAYSIDNSTPLYSAMVARKNYIPEITKKVYPESQYDLSSVSKHSQNFITESGDVRTRANQIEELYDTAYDNIDESMEYARYWHGYLVFLRPLLVLFDYATIRIISTIAFLIILVIFTYLMSKKTSIYEAITFLIGFLLVGGFLIASSMNEIVCFYIAFISSIYVLLRYEKIKNINLFFFVIGMITNFIDFFTNPIITLGIPMLVYFVLLQKQEKLGYKEIILKYIKIILSWGIGFALTWVSKWVIIDILYNKGIIKIALVQSLFRTVSYGVTGKMTIFQAFNDNIVYLGEDIIILMMIPMLIYMLLPFKKQDINLKRGLPYILTSALPFAWIIAILNHSGEHAFFVYRNFSITIISILLLFLSQIKRNT